MPRGRHDQQRLAQNAHIAMARRPWTRTPPQDTNKLLSNLFLASMTICSNRTKPPGLERMRLPRHHTRR